jgi:hypothetical protein
MIDRLLVFRMLTVFSEEEQPIFLTYVFKANLKRAGLSRNWSKLVIILLLPFRVQFELVWQADLNLFVGGKSLKLRQIIRKWGFP